ncbi:uncharacterized protein LOC106871607 [Octopus bimaculoides]|uniref:Uncharacterized protein n=1 Tax=Octopus bimaculoides TaxID=37653 RepID=A0A0L8HD75_OCTBM|nr:uncharacterized protein LOC106871607 [Octopus bimaculoides]|eukprot:XP_014773646.1 PREDICTED: uncharacterized protein LOC106871607 [Octopus bimaculoides]
MRRTLSGSQIEPQPRTSLPVTQSDSQLMETAEKASQKQAKEIPYNSIFDLPDEVFLKNFIDEVRNEKPFLTDSYTLSDRRRKAMNRRNAEETQGYIFMFETDKYGPRVITLLPKIPEIASEKSIKYHE